MVKINEIDGTIRNEFVSLYALVEVNHYEKRISIEILRRDNEIVVMARRKFSLKLARIEKFLDELIAEIFLTIETRKLDLV